MNSYTFSSEILIIGTNPYVPVPEDVLSSLLLDAGKLYGPLPVTGEINRCAFKQTVVKYLGIWRLYINGMMVKAAQVQVGDIVNITIQFDSSDRSEKMPKRLLEEFDKHPSAKMEYGKLPAYKKKEILRYLNNLKTTKSRERNIKKLISYLSGEKVEGFIALTYKR